MKVIFFVLPVLVIATSCLNLSSLQTARSIGKNNAEVGIGVTYFPESKIYRNDDTLAYATRTISLLGTYGLTDRLDVYAAISGYTQFRLGAKYQLTKDSSKPFMAAIGGSFMYSSYQSSIKYGRFLNVRDIHLPLYLSYDFSDKTTAYLNPTIIFRNDDYTYNGTRFRSTTALTGGSAGFTYRIGQDMIFAEGSYYQGVNYWMPVWQISIAYKHRLNFRKQDGI